jgi:hypothetical protein
MCRRIQPAQGLAARKATLLACREVNEAGKHSPDPCSDDAKEQTILFVPKKAMS